MVPNYLNWCLNWEIYSIQIFKKKKSRFRFVNLVSGNFTKKANGVKQVIEWFL